MDALKDRIIKELNSKEDFKTWGVLEKYCNDNGFTLDYVNRYYSQIIINDSEAVGVDCENIYGVSIIESFTK
jgi:hypothetical protein